MKNKERLFENVNGNRFVLLTEGVDESTVCSGIKRVFSNGEKSVSYSQIECVGVGLGFIKDIAGARRHALQEAKKIAKEFNYSDNELNEMFVKSEGNSESVEAVEAVQSVHHDETDMSNPEESRELQIGKEILEVMSDRIAWGNSNDKTYARIKKLAEELIDMHDGTVSLPK